MVSSAMTLSSFPRTRSPSPKSRLCDAFGVVVEENVYGKNAIQRSTFLFERGGRLVRVWPKVTVLGHADEVLKAL